MKLTPNFNFRAQYAQRGGRINTPEQAAAKVAELAADKRAKARRAQFKVIEGGKA